LKSINISGIETKVISIILSHARDNAALEAELLDVVELLKAEQRKLNEYKSILSDISSKF